MGIEDFNLDLEEHADNVLVFSESKESAETIGKYLAKREYNWESHGTIGDAKKAAIKVLFDLVIIDAQDSSETPNDLVAGIQSDANLRRIPFLLIHEDAATFMEGGSTVFGPNSQALGTPLDPSALLVKVAMLLRLRKIKTEQADFESTIASQNAELRDLTNRFKKELSEAKAIQEAIHPKSLPSAPNTMFAAYFEPFEAVGGDLYDIWKIDEDLYGLFLGDVTGHGLPAAFIGAMTKMAISYAPTNSPDEMMTHINNGVSALMPDGRFVTAALAFYKPSNGQLLLARAGHPAPYIFRAETGEYEALTPKGLPLGILEGGVYECIETTMQPGDKFLMISDALIETANMSTVMFGEEGVGLAFAEAAKSEPIGKCIEIVLEKQHEFSEGRVVRDDHTLIGFERLK